MLTAKTQRKRNVRKEKRPICTRLQSILIQDIITQPWANRLRPYRAKISSHFLPCAAQKNSTVD